eukprot:m.231762 g.231762  ORF g.231762 m.231762 type:complete len:95 (+) comp33609_c0_seq1:1067-1351(+)
MGISTAFRHVRVMGVSSSRSFTIKRVGGPRSAFFDAYNNVKAAVETIPMVPVSAITEYHSTFSDLFIPSHFCQNNWVLLFIKLSSQDLSCAVRM